jgi:hypothetical protein
LLQIRERGVLVVDAVNVVDDERARRRVQVLVDADAVRLVD